MAALRLTDFDEILTRHLQGRLHRLRAARHQKNMRHAGGGPLQQNLGQFFCRTAGEETAVHIVQPPQLISHSGNHLWMVMPQAGNRSAATSIDISFAVGIGDFKSAGRGCLGHKRLGVTVKHMGHGEGLQAVTGCDYGQLVIRSDQWLKMRWGPAACLLPGLGLT